MNTTTVIRRANDKTTPAAVPVTAHPVPSASLRNTQLDKGGAAPVGIERRLEISNTTAKTIERLGRLEQVLVLIEGLARGPRLADLARQAKGLTAHCVDDAFRQHDSFVELYRDIKDGAAQ